jgi:hypothetical protein
MNIDQRAEIYREILKYRRFPDDIFSGSPERLNALQSAIFGKH